MRRPDPELLRLAERILVYEADRTNDELSPIERACSSLQRHLDRLIGLRGFHALLSRAIFLSRNEYPWLGPLRVSDGDGCELHGVTDATTAAGDEAMIGFATVIATTIWLLASFVGEHLTVRFLREAWPEVSFDPNLLPEGSMYEQ
jgi:hypothetical protein